MVEMPSVPKYSMSYHGAGRYDLIFVVSVNRTRITKSCVAELFSNEWTVSGGRELLITENVQIETSLGDPVAGTSPFSAGSTGSIPG